jgi:phosphatidylglycerophosphate synthase
VRTVRATLTIGLIGQLTLLILLTRTAAGLGPLGWITGLGCAAGVNLLLATGLLRAGAIGPGPADRITLARATLVGAIAALVVDSFLRPVSVAVLVTLAVIALGLDAVDGAVARRTGTASALGARFDLEVDAFLIFVLSVYVAGDYGGWVLIIGSARYAFVAAGWAWPWLREPTPPRYWCKVVAAIQGIVLTVAVAGVLPRPAGYAAIAIALVLLAESFGGDVWWLARHHARSERSRPQLTRTVSHG